MSSELSHCVECGGTPRPGRLRCAICDAPAIKYATVCDQCLRASCWQGMFMCDEARTAGTMDLDVRYLAMKALESPSYWGIDSE
mgnify:CR=1 FL=1